MYYLVDGYNLLFRLEDSGKKNLEKRREELIELLNIELACFKSSVSIIFDSSEQIREFPQIAKLENIEIIYAPKGQTADQYIIELVELSKSPKTLTVVTSDSGLTRQCRHIGSQVLTIDAFITYVIKKNQKKCEAKSCPPKDKKELERLCKIFEERYKNK